MAFMVTSTEGQEEKMIGIKLEISPEILPRDTSLGTKIFMLVPSVARNVREVKSYISNFVLKTPVPFQFFMGDYRIRDEEDARIFSIVDEPCRLAPVPPPRSALSSTPKPKSSIEKRVTFFDGDLTASPVHAHFVNGVDAIDYSQSGRSIHSPEDMQLEGLSSIKVENDATNDQELNLSDSSTERKKRRRRRHRSRKSKSASDENVQDQDDSMNGSASVDPEENGCASNTLGNGVTKWDSSANLDKSHLEVLNEETESEDETAGESSVQKEFEFVTPVTCPSKVSRKRSEMSEVQGGKKKKLSDSAFESSCSFISPVSSAEDSRCSSGKPRQDTPNVPRVVRNPKMFNSVRKIFDVYTAGQGENIQKDESANHNNGSITQKTHSAPAAATAVKDEDGYKNMRLISCVEEVNVGDHVAFKVLELDERYNPAISAYKEGIVSDKTGTQLRITFTKNNIVVRTGRYDLDISDDSKDAKGKDTKPAEPETVELHFAELLEPKFISQLQVFSTTSAMRPSTQAGQLVEGNGYSSSSPPSTI